MKKFVAAVLSIIATLSLTSCANVQKVPMNPASRESIHSTVVIPNSTQREIVLQHNNWFSSDKPDPYTPMDRGAIARHQAGYTIMNAGVLGVLVSEGIKKHNATSMTKGIGPIRVAIDNVDFMKILDANLKRSLQKINWLKDTQHKIRYSILENESDILKKSKQNTALLIGTTYALNSVFRQLEVVAYVELIQKASTRKGYRTLYANTFNFVNRLPKPNTNANFNKQRWIANNGALLNSKLHDAAYLISDMIAMDLQNPALLPTGNKSQISFRSINGFILKGQLIQKKRDYLIISTNSMSERASLYAVNKADLSE